MGFDWINLGVMFNFGDPLWRSTLVVNLVATQSSFARKPKLGGNSADIGQSWLRIGQIWAGVDQN